MYKHRHAFRIDDWHFERADWYKLSDLGLKFYGGLDFSISLDSTIVDRVKNWHKYMSKKTREVDFEKEISLSRTKSILQEIKNSFRNDDRGEYGNISNSNWLIERFKGPLDVLGWTPEKTLVEIGKWRKV